MQSSTFGKFVDAHVHLAMMAEQRVWLDLRGLDSPEAIAAASAARSPGVSGWILGFGWALEFPPHRGLLDDALPRTPCFLERIDGHAAWVNTAALRRAGLRGAPGILTDEGLEPMRRVLPSAVTERGLLGVCQELAAWGLAEVHDLAVECATWETLERLDLPLEVYGFADVRGEGFDALMARRSERILGVKLFVDGALGSRGAALFEPYADDPGNLGFNRPLPPLAPYFERGLQVAIHALGDRAVALALDALEAARAPPGRARLEHVEMAREADLDRMARMGVVASIQPSHLPADLPWLEARVGKERLSRCFPWAAMVERGIPILLGSDAPIGDPDPIRTRQIWTQRLGDPFVGLSVP